MEYGILAGKRYKRYFTWLRYNTLGIVFYLFFLSHLLFYYILCKSASIRLASRIRVKANARLHDLHSSMDTNTIVGSPLLF